MVIDEDYRGVPVAFILFSAPHRSNRTSAGYDSDILHKLLKQWKHFLEKDSMVEFKPKMNYVFSIRQYISNAKKVLMHQVEQCKEQLSNQCLGVLEGAVKFCTYLEEVWLGELIYGWCSSGRKHIAKECGIELRYLPTTNNHLESFNNTLKSIHLTQYQHQGRRLRVDSLVVCLIKFIIPDVLLKRKLNHRLAEQLQERKEKYSQNDLIKIPHHEFETCAFQVPSPQRDSDAKVIIEKGLISYFEENAKELFVWIRSQRMENTTYIVQLMPPASTS
ncbi:899_t:CDS:2, partial [Ambispora gerdemannii]